MRSDNVVEEHAQREKKKREERGRERIRFYVDLTLISELTNEAYRLYLYRQD